MLFRSLERQVLPSARRLSQLDESKVLPQLDEIDEDTRQITASDLTSVIEAEFKALDETGIARPELDLGLDTDDDTDGASAAKSA